MAGLTIRPILAHDRDQVLAMVSRHFGSAQVVSRGIMHNCAELDGFVATDIDGCVVGLVQFDVQSDELEIVAIVSERAGQGLGKRLLDQVVARCQEQNIRRLWLITTNNNVVAIRFYKSLGWTLVAVHDNAVTASRELKPEIPAVDSAGVTIRDEWEFEYPNLIVSD